MSEPLHHYLVAYDIAHPKRLNRVYRCMKRWGVPAQYSLFVIEQSEAGVQRLMAELRPLLDDRRDDIRIYPLPPQPDAVKRGQQRLDGLLIHNGVVNATVFSG